MNNNIEPEKKEEIKKLNDEYIITADTNIDELRKIVNNQQNTINDLMKIVEDFEDRIYTIEASI